MNNMSFLQGDFIDSQNIIIIDRVPHYSLSGKSYIEKLKNGLSLDLVFEMEYSAVKPYENFEEKIEEVKQIQPYKYELFAEEYDYDICRNNRKGKQFIKKISNRNTKKNKIHQNGYDDKVHIIETNLPSIYEPKLDLQYYPFDMYDYIYDLWYQNNKDYDHRYDYSL